MKKLEKEEIKELFSVRKEDCHKGDFGYVGILGGCQEYSGAIKLANLSCASLRSGCGVVRVIVPKEIADYVAPYLLEQTLYTIHSKDYHMEFCQEEIDNALEKLKALAIGMGWGKGKDHQKILQYILETKKIPIVIDADGLNTLANIDKEILKKTKCQVILTPHFKEFERISGKPIQEIREDPEKLANDFAKEYHVILLL